MARISHLKILELKSVMKKSTEGITSTAGE
jgi:hypothetical protein